MRRYGNLTRRDGLSPGEPVLRLQRLNETHFGLHDLGSLDLDVAMMDFSPVPRTKMCIRPAAPAKMIFSPFERKRPNLLRVIYNRLSRSDDQAIRLCSVCKF